MPSIDERVVAMSFENQVFETRVAQTMATLSKLDAAVRNLGGGNSGFDNLETAANKVTFQGPMSALDKLKAKFSSTSTGASQDISNIETSGSRLTLTSPFKAIDNLAARFTRLSAGSTFTDIEKASDRTTLSGLSNAIDTVTSKFSVLQGAASVALGNIASQAVSRGGSFVKSFAFGPIQQGLGEYSTNLNAIQTILANTDGQQVSGLGNVNKALGDLNTYSDKTIYNFSEMAKNIGTFTAAGVDLPTATESIKGIANLAALSGSNSEQASTAMYQLSQAISSGKVGLQDWNSVVNAGMGGAVFQKALIRTGQNMGTIAQGAVEIDKKTGKATINGNTFRDSIMAKPGQKPWLTSDVLTKTLGQFTGDLKTADLAAQGFDASQIKAIQNTAKNAQNAATQVKTLPQVFDVARETIGSGWSQTFSLLFGNFGQAKVTFTALSNTINGVINRSSKARNDLLKAFDALGGRDKLIQAIKTAFSALFAAIKPVADAFHSIFPPTTAQGLIGMVDGFQHLADAVRGFFKEHGGQLQSTFEGVFAVLHIGVTIVKEAFRAIGRLFGLVAGSSGGFLGLTASIGKFLVSVDKAVTKGGLLRGLFDGLVTGIKGVLGLFKGLGSAIGNLFSGGDKATGLSKAMGQVTTAGAPLAAVADAISSAWDKVKALFERVKTLLDPAFSAIGKAASGLADNIKNALSAGNFDRALAVLQTGLLGGILLVLKKFKSSIAGALTGGGLFDKVNGVLGALTNNLKAMQQNLQAKTLFTIAAALGVLVAGIYVLSTIDGKKLTTAMTAMAIGMGELVGVMALLGKTITGPGKAGFIAMPFIAAGMIGLAVAAVILAAAVKIFATMSWEDLAKGLIGVAGSLVAVGAAMKLMGPSTLIQGPALILIAVAVRILAGAVEKFASIPLKPMVQGLLGMGFAFVALAAGLNLMGPSLIITGPGLIAVAIGMNMLAGAVAAFGSMDIGKMAQGILGIGGALVVLGVGLTFIGPEAILAGPALLLVAIGMTALAGAIGILGSLKVDTLVKGIAAMGAALVVLGLGLTFMSGTLAGSAALLVAASAMAILGPALGILGKLDFKTVAKGLGFLVVTLAVLAIAGATVAAPLAAFALALGLLGIALSLVTAPIYIFAKALALMGATGAKGIAVMLTALTAFVTLLPTLVISFIKGLVDILASLADILPKVVVALGTILDTIIAFVIQASPRLAVAIGTLVDAILQVLLENSPKLISAGFQLLQNVLDGLNSNIGPIVASVATVIGSFLGALAAQAPNLVAAGVNTIASFLLGIAEHVGELVLAATNIMAQFLIEVAKAVPKVAVLAGTIMVNFITALGTYITRVVKAGVDMVLSIMSGITNAIPRLVKKALEVSRAFLNGVADGMAGLADIGFKAIIRFMNGLAKAIRDNADPLFNAGAGIAKAIIDAMVQQFGKLGPVLRKALESVFSLLPGWARKVLGISSPSKVFMVIGRQTMQGMAQGVSQGGAAVEDSMSGTADNVVKTGRAMFKSLDFGVMADTSPVITPVLDLTHVKRGASELDGLLPQRPLLGVGSSQQAATVANETSKTATSGGGGGMMREAYVVNYEQNNYSPETLNPVEIYRRTKNGLSQVKQAVGFVPAAGYG
jgi:tape measure domain-containing protein